MSTKLPFSTRQPIHWVLDWDGTITKRDTLDTLVSIAASSKPDFPTQKHWERVTKAYLEDYTETLEKLAPGGTLPSDVAKEKDLFQKLKIVEQRSLDRVSDSGIFAGLTEEQLKEGARKAITSQQVQLRAGFTTFLEWVQTLQTQQNHKFGILSVNWSARFIAAALEGANAQVDLGDILSNELEGLADGIPTTGHIVPAADTMITASADKLQQLERIREANKVSGNPRLIVYVGDSWTDIEGLLDADLGICIRDDPMGSSQRQLAEALERLGVACPQIQHCKDADQCNIVWAKDFTQIKNWAETQLAER